MNEKADMKLSIFLVSERGGAIAARIMEAYPRAALHGPRELREGGLKRKAAYAFKRSDALLFISASGIAVRAVAPLLKGKAVDPAVVVVDEAGRFAISLVSGHLGGANELARRIAGLTGATAVVTTATDAAGLPCIEEAAERAGCGIEDPRRIKAINSAILDGAKVRVVDADAARRAELMRLLNAGPGGRGGKKDARRKDGGGAGATVVVSSRASTGRGRGCPKRTLVLRPREFVAGVGFMKGVGVAELERALRDVMAAAGLSPLSLGGIATIDIKRGGPVEKAAKRARVKAVFYSADELNGVNAPSGPSAASRHTAARAVAEPAALLLSGGKRLWLRKTKRGRVTVALAKVPFRSWGSGLASSNT